MVYEAQAPENLEGKGWRVALASDQLLFASNRNNLNIGLKLRGGTYLARVPSERHPLNSVDIRVSHAVSPF